MAFAESLVLFLFYQKLFTFEKFSLLNYKESSFKDQKFLLQN